MTFNTIRWSSRPAQGTPYICRTVATAEARYPAVGTAATVRRLTVDGSAAFSVQVPSVPDGATFALFYDGTDYTGAGALVAVHELAPGAFLADFQPFPAVVESLAVAGRITEVGRLSVDDGAIPLVQLVPDNEPLPGPILEQVTKINPGGATALTVVAAYRAGAAGGNEIARAQIVSVPLDAGWGVNLGIIVGNLYGATAVKTGATWGGGFVTPATGSAASDLTLSGIWLVPRALVDVSAANLRTETTLIHKNGSTQNAFVHSTALVNTTIEIPAGDPTEWWRVGTSLQWITLGPSPRRRYVRVRANFAHAAGAFSVLLMGSDSVLDLTSSLALPLSTDANNAVASQQALTDAVSVLSQGAALIGGVASSIAAPNPASIGVSVSAAAGLATTIGGIATRRENRVTAPGMAMAGRLYRDETAGTHPNIQARQYRSGDIGVVERWHIDRLGSFSWSTAGSTRAWLRGDVRFVGGGNAETAQLVPGAVAAGVVLENA